MSAYSETKQLREKQIRALMNLHGMSRKEAESHAAKKAALRKVASVKKNPIGTLTESADYFLMFSDGTLYSGKAGPAFKTRDIWEAFPYTEAGAYRKAETGPMKMHGARPVHRDELTRIKKNPVAKALYARPRSGPAKKSRHFTVQVENGDSWETRGIFPSETLAREYAQALDRQFGNTLKIRVTV